MREIGHFVGGKEAKGNSGRFGDIFDPNTGEVQAKVALARHADVEHAIAVAASAQPAWAATNPQRRARIMFRFLELVNRDPDHLAALLSEAELPPGILKVVNGDKEAVDPLLTDPRVMAVGFVGSSATAEYVYSPGCANGKRVQCLGGAKNHMIVMPDADLDQAVDALIGAGYGSAGERCMA